MKAAKIIRVQYLIKEHNAKATATAEFLKVLAFDKHSRIGGAVYLNNKNRPTRLRRPKEFPRVEDLEKLQNATITRMKEMLDDIYL